VLGMNYWAVIVAAVTAFVEGAVWNSSLLFGNERMRLLGINADAMTDTKIPAGKMLGELLKVLVIAYVLAHLLALLGVVDWMAAVRLGAWVWIGFQATLLLGAVIWENMPWKLYAIHAGDALVKILLMAAILGVWR
jgi:hypothetical protein